MFGSPIDPERTVRTALEALCEFSEIRVPRLVHMDNLSFGDSLSHWKAPDQGCFKFNCDIAVSKDGQDTVLQWSSVTGRGR